MFLLQPSRDGPPQIMIESVEHLLGSPCMAVEVGASSKHRVQEPKLLLQRAPCRGLVEQLLDALPKELAAASRDHARAHHALVRRVRSNTDMVPQETKRAGHLGDQRLRVRELQPEALAEPDGQSRLLRLGSTSSPFRLVGTRWYRDEDDEVVCIPNGIEHGMATPTSSDSAFPGSSRDLGRMGAKRGRAARPHVLLIPFLDRAESDVGQRGGGTGSPPAASPRRSSKRPPPRSPRPSRRPGRVDKHACLRFAGETSSSARGGRCCRSIP